MGGINQPKPVPCTAHKFSGETDETIDLELSIKIFSAQKQFAKFLIGIDHSLLEERRENIDIAIHRLIVAADQLAISVDELGYAALLMEIYIESLGNPRTPDGFKKLLTDEAVLKIVIVTDSDIRGLVRNEGYESGLSSIREQLLGVESLLKILKKDTSVLIDEAKSVGIEKSLTVGSSQLRKNCHKAAHRWSRLLLEWSEICAIGNEAYRAFYSKAT